MLAATAVVAAVTLLRLGKQLLDGQLMSTFVRSMYWVDYRDGFIRRGLPGEVVGWLPGEPTSGLVFAVGLVLTVGACAAVAALVYRLLERVELPLLRLSVAALVAASPLTLMLLPRGVGRYDTIGLIALALVVVLPPRWRWSPWAAAGALSVVVAVACASEEFLGAYLAPVALLASWRLGQQLHRAASMAALILTPGAIIALWGFAADPSRGFISGTVRRAEEAGIDVSSVPGGNGIEALGYSVEEQLALYDARDTVQTVLLPILMAGAFVAFSATVWWLAGKPAPRLAALAGGWLALTAVALSVVGIDFGRWWALAFVGFVAFLAALPPSGQEATRPMPERVRVWVLGLALVCVLGVNAPIWPGLT